MITIILLEKDYWIFYNHKVKIIKIIYIIYFICKQLKKITPHILVLELFLKFLYSLMFIFLEKHYFNPLLTDLNYNSSNFTYKQLTINDHYLRFPLVPPYFKRSIIEDRVIYFLSLWLLHKFCGCFQPSRLHL